MTASARSRARRAIAVLCLVLGQSLVAGVAPVAAAGELPSTVTLSVDPNPGFAFNQVTFTSSVNFPSGTSDPQPTGSISYYETTSGSPVLVASAPYNGGPQAVVYTYLSGFDLGTHTLIATVTLTPDTYAPSTSDPVDYVVNQADSSTWVNGSVEVEAHHPILLEASVGAPTNAYNVDTTVTFRRTGVSDPICVVPMTDTNLDQCTVPSLPVGSYEFTAEYSGNAWVAGSTSDPWPVSVVPDTVHATNVGVGATTFYPVKDSYLDTVAVKGTRSEPIGVTVKIYKPSGVYLRTVTIASGSGAYSWAWNGRTSAGSILPEGKYKVVQTLKDTAGTTKSWTSYVNLSKKKLYVSTKTITKLGSQLKAKGAINGAKVTISTTSDYAKLTVPGFYEAWAGAGWELTMPSATIYRSFYVRIYGRHTSVGGGTEVGAQNFNACAYSDAWDVSCFGALKEIPPTSSNAYTRTVNLNSAYRHGRTVRIIVSSYGASTYIYKAQVVVTYGVLKY